MASWHRQGGLAVGMLRLLFLIVTIAARASADVPYGSYGSLPRGFQSRRLLTDGSYSKGQCSSLMHILRFTGELISLKAVIDDVPAIQSQLSDPGAVLTVLAPTNKALAAGPPGSEDEALILSLHVLEGSFKAADLADGQAVTTLGGTTLTVSVATSGMISFTAAGGGPVATVIAADLMSCGGVLHIIDTALTPGAGTLPPVEDPPAVGLPDALTDPSVEDPFPSTPVPDEPAAGPLPADPELSPTSEGPSVVTPPLDDVPTVAPSFNGPPAVEDPLADIPSVDPPFDDPVAVEDPPEDPPSVDPPFEDPLMMGAPLNNPPADTPPVDAPPISGNPGGCDSLLAVIESTAELSNLKAAVLVADLGAVLGDPSAALTVLAPTNAGLNVEQLGGEELQEVLGLHVIEGAFKAADLSDGRTLTTLGGATLTVSLGDGTVSFTAGDGANVGTVLTADLMSCSGVLHIIDTALSPPTSATNPPTVTPPPITPPTGNPPPVDPPAGDAPVATTPSTDPPTTEPVPVDPPTLPPPVLPPPAEVRPPAPKGPTLTLPPPVTFPPVNVPPFSFPTVAHPPLPTLNPPPGGPFFPVPPFLKPPTGTPTGGSFVTKKGSTSSKKVESSESDSASVSS